VGTCPGLRGRLGTFFGKGERVMLNPTEKVKFLKAKGKIVGHSAVGRGGRKKELYVNTGGET